MKSKPSFVATILMLFFAASAAHQAAKAQVAIDVEKITCGQFIRFSVADPDQIGLWLNGYFHGKHGDSTFRVQEFRKNLADLKKACRSPENSEVPVLQVTEKLFPKK
jgi:hypothetical protein